MKLIIFDLDGTLIDSLTDLANSCNKALQQSNFPTHPIDDYKIFVGNGLRKLIVRALPEPSRTDPIITKVMYDFKQHYAQHGKDHSKLYEGIASLLTTLKEKGFLLSVATNKYHQAAQEIVDHYFSPSTFDLVMGQEDHRPSKPDPAIVRETLQRLNVLATDSYYLGDSSVDMLTAKAASVKAIGVTWGFRTEQELLDHGADHIIHQPADLLSLLD